MKTLGLILFLGLAWGDDTPYVNPVDEITTSSVTKESFHRVFYTICGLYSRELSQMDLPVVPVAEWEQAYLTAYVARVDGVIKLGFWGGLARVGGMNDEAVALITCHEIGHILGGEPFIKINHPEYKNLSSEGQADYFATKECLKRYYLYLDGDDPELLKEKVYKGISGFGEALKILKPKRGIFELLGTSQEIVGETIYNGYPSNQCRIDTFKAGLDDLPRPGCWYVEKH